MSKNLLQDIVKVKNGKKGQATNFKYSLDRNNLFLSQNTINQVSKNNKPKYKLWIIALISVVFLLFSLSFLFAKAKIKIISKTQNISLNQNLSAVKDGNVDKVLPFHLIVISDEENKLVPVADTKDIMTKAMGKVLVYNTFSTAPQTLSKDTQLEGSNGKIYKIVSKVVIPGMNKNGTAGQIGVNIYANAPGEEYNSSPLDFVILSFKGTLKYTKFKVRSQGDITGGMKGKYYKTQDTDKNLLLTKLLQKATNQIPLGFILFKDTASLKMDENSVGATSVNDVRDNMVPIKIRATLYGFLLNEKELTKTIAKNVINQYDGSDIHIPDIKNLIFSLSDKTLPPTDVTNINFNLSGVLKIVWDVNTTKLINDLLGKSKKDFTQILSAYPNIVSANVTFRPFWVMSFPDKEKNIELNIAVN